MIDITSPTLIIDEERIRRNIKRMVNKTNRNRVKFRPHFKTHQSAEIGEWFRKVGVSSITVSSVDMAYYFMKHGWDDITIAIPINIRQISQIDNLADKITLNLLVESKQAVKALEKNLTNHVNIWIEIDIGYPRTGIRWDNRIEILKIADAIKTANNLSLIGILTHAGHAYHTSSIMEIKKIHSESISRMVTVKEFLESNGHNDIEISIGDTPTCTISEDFSRVSEIRPGNFVFYDLMQVNLGVCKEEDIAAFVAVPIIAKYPERHECVIYGGAVHLSNDFIHYNSNKKLFGKVILRENNQWTTSIPHTIVTNLTQEHGIISTTAAFLTDIDIGDIIYILPVHSCLTANLFSSYLTLNGHKINNIHSY